jgi:hypothetical protein
MKEPKLSQVSQEELDRHFISNIRSYLASRPQLLGSAINAMNSGIQDHLMLQNQRCVDMETIASIAVNQRLYKSCKKTIVSKLKVWKAELRFNWDDQIKELEK